MCALLAAIVRKALRGRADGSSSAGNRGRTSLLSASWFEPDRGTAPSGAADFLLRLLRGRSRIPIFGPRRTRMRPTETPAGCILLKCVRGDSASRALRSSKEAMRPKKTILCVDDNEQGLAVRKFLLETRGYRVVTACSAHDAIELLRSGSIDLVLSDLLMPQMDGNEMVHRMKGIAPDVPMMLLSGTVKAFDRACHADAFLPKGACSPVELLERVRVMIARKRGPKKVVARPVFDDAYSPAYAGRPHPAVAS